MDEREVRVGARSSLMSEWNIRFSRSSGGSERGESNLRDKVKQESQTFV